MADAIPAIAKASSAICEHLVMKKEPFVQELERSPDTLKYSLSLFCGADQNLETRAKTYQYQSRAVQASSLTTSHARGFKARA